jgi:hypothetical protein
MTDADEASDLRRKLSQALETITELEHENAGLRRPRAVPAVSTAAAEVPHTNPELAEAMFNAYNEHGAQRWKTFDGRDVPRWRDITPEVRAKWVAAAVAARLLVLSHDSELAR